MKLTEAGKGLINRYGYRFDVLHSPQIKVTEKRARRLTELYLAVLNAGEIDERTFRFEDIPAYRSCLRATFLRDLRFLEDIGLLKCDLLFPCGKVPSRDVFKADNQQ